MILYNVGDSHTFPGPWRPDVKDHYWYKIGMHDYGCTEYINDSKIGRSHEYMFKSVIRHCLENPDQPTLYIINTTTIFRMELSTEKTHMNLQDLLVPSAIADIDFETLETTLYSNLIGVIEFLKTRNKQFLVINNSKNFSSDQLPMRDAFVDYFKKEHRILNWFDNSRIFINQEILKIKPWDFNLYGWNGHNGVDADNEYYQSLRKLLPAI